MKPDEPTPPEDRQADRGGTRPPRPQRITSRALLGAARELVIDHDGREYRLRITQQGKLILTA